jgi:CRP-like cAMP-binding protein
MLKIQPDQIEIVHQLPGSLCQALLDLGRVEEVEPGSIIVNEGDHLDCLYIVLEGQLEALLPDIRPRISAVRLGRLGPGKCFGEYAFVDRQPASATIRAITGARVFSIGYDDLYTLFDEHPAVPYIIYGNLLKILVRRLREQNAELDLFTVAF